MMLTRLFLPALAAVICFAQEVSDPWPKTDLVEPAALAHTLQSGKTPIVIAVAFPVLYNSKHIAHAIFAGPGSKPEGIEALKKTAARYPKDSDIVLYCGCCPMLKCPNIRPAYRALREMGFTHIRILDIPTNMHTDWFAKDYPSEAGTASPAPASQ